MGLQMYARLIHIIAGLFIFAASFAAAVGIKMALKAYLLSIFL